MGYTVQMVYAGYESRAAADVPLVLDTVSRALGMSPSIYVGCL